MPALLDHHRADISPAILDRLENVKQTSSGWSATCSAHDDKTASLSIALGDDGRTLINCHAGCATSEIVGKVGMTMKDLFPSNGRHKRNGKPSGNHKPSNSKPKPKPKRYATLVGVRVNVIQYLTKTHGPGVEFAGEWDYGAFWVLRFNLPTPPGEKQRKEFRPAHLVPIGVGDTKWWQLGYPDGKHHLYRKSEIDAAPDDAIPVVNGGEKAADAAAAIGLLATTNAGGETAIDKTDWTPLARFPEVDVVVDNDHAGEKFGRAVYAKLKSQNPEQIIKIIRLPGLPPKGDVVEWIAAGGTKEEFLRLVDAEPAATAEETAEKLPSKEIDAGPEADKFLQCTMTDGVPRMRFWRGSWMYWDRAAYAELPPSEARAELVKHLDTRFFGLTGSTTSNVVDCLKAKAILPGRTEPPAWIGDKPGPWPADEVLAAKNGLVHIPSLVTAKDYTIPATPRFFTSNALDYDFHADAPAPANWLTFLSQLWPEDADSMATMQEWLGYTLTPDTRQQKILMVVGPKRSGKGTIARVQRSLIGVANCCGPTLASLSLNFGLQPLLGKSAAIISDARLGKRTDSQIVVERLLSISGEDALTIDRKFLEPVTAKLPTRLMIFSNELPRLGDSSGALSSRMILLRLTQSFFGREDHDLGVKLQAELPGILLWAIEGWRRLRQRGRFVQPNSARELIGDLEDLSSPIGQFLREQCVIGEGRRVSRPDIYAAYKEWCQEHGRKQVDDESGFGRGLRAAVSTITDSQPRVDGQRIRHYEGIGLSGW